MSLEIIEVQRQSPLADFDPRGFTESHCERRRAMNDTELRVVLYEECGLGRITVEMESYFNFSFEMSEALEKLERRFACKGSAAAATRMTAHEREKL